MKGHVRKKARSSSVPMMAGMKPPIFSMDTPSSISSDSSMTPGKLPGPREGLTMPFSQLTEAMWRFLADTQQTHPLTNTLGQNINSTKAQAIQESTSTDFDWPIATFGGLGTVPDNVLNLTTLAEGLSPGQDCGGHGLPTPPFPSDLGGFEFPITNDDNSGRHCRETARSVEPHKTRPTYEPSRPNFPGKDAPLYERLNCLKECADLLGFGSLDTAMSAYYTADLSESPTMFNEQCLSRNRRLPSLLSEVRENSKTWNRWEQVGYAKETLRGAEDIYAEECKQASTELDAELAGIMEKELTVELIPKATWALQNKVRFYPKSSKNPPGRRLI